MTRLSRIPSATVDDAPSARLWRGAAMGGAVGMFGSSAGSVPACEKLGFSLYWNSDANLQSCELLPFEVNNCYELN